MPSVVLDGLKTGGDRNANGAKRFICIIEAYFQLIAARGRDP
jgi:hypothetical protein